MVAEPHPEPPAGLSAAEAARLTQLTADRLAEQRRQLRAAVDGALDHLPSVLRRAVRRLVGA